jgi:adenosine deaminase
VSRDLGTLPKTQLHLHLAGAMRPATLRELAEAYGVPVPSNDARKLKDWAQFQGLYDAARAVIRTPDDVARVLTEAASDDADDGCGWLEIQVDPTSYAPVIGGLRETLEAVLAAATKAPIPARRACPRLRRTPGGHADRPRYVGRPRPGHAGSAGR